MKRPPKTQSPDFPKFPREFVEMHNLNDHAQDVVEGRWFRLRGTISKKRIPNEGYYYAV